MTGKPRYRLRAKSAALTRFQWWIVGIAILLEAVGALLALTRSDALGAMLMSLSSLVVVFTLVSAVGRTPSK